MSLSSLLVTYVDRICGPPGANAEVENVASVDGAEAAVIATAAILSDAIAGTRDPDHAYAALTWLRDASIGVGSASTRLAVRACIPELLVPTLAKALFAPNREVRGWVIYTFGKMTFRENLPILLDAFDWYADRDPLLLPKLIGEIAWLGGDAAPLLARVQTHSLYLTRWSFFGTEYARVTPSNAHLRTMCIRSETDEAAVVQAEARYVRAEIDMVDSLSKEGLLGHARAAKQERKRRRTEHLLSRPPLLFLDLFGARVSSAMPKDCDVAALDAFVRSLVPP